MIICCPSVGGLGTQQKNRDKENVETRLLVATCRRVELSSTAAKAYVRGRAGRCEEKEGNGNLQKLFVRSEYTINLIMEIGRIEEGGHRVTNSCGSFLSE